MPRDLHGDLPGGAGQFAKPAWNRQHIELRAAIIASQWFCVDVAGND